jgi:hypothetical protein
MFVALGATPRRFPENGTSPMTTDLSDQSTAEVRYAYKASLIGAAHQFELRDDGLSWQVGGKSGVWPYADIAAIRLSYRPVSMQSRRFRADIESINRQRIAILSTSWQTVALMAPQDRDYRAFITQLHRRMRDAGSRAALIGGIGPKTYAAGWDRDIGTFRSRHSNRRIFGRVVSGRLCRPVWVADRRLYQA